MSPKDWKTFSLTEVLFNKKDPLSIFFAFSSLLPVSIIVFLSGYASSLSSRRIPSLVLLMFLVMSCVLNFILKTIINQPRPKHPSPQHHLKNSEGMPSDHAQFMTFFITYLAFRALRSGQANSTSGGEYTAHKRANAARTRNMGPGKLDVLGRPSAESALAVVPPSWTMILVLLIIAILVIVGRVYNHYHTVPQVVVGACVGFVLALIASMQPMQRVMSYVAEVYVVPIMLRCTVWANLIH